MPKVDYTAEKKAALEMLTPDDLAKIQKDYPLKKVRDAKIYEVLQMGFSIKVVSEISGLKYAPVWRISNYGIKQIAENDLIKIQAAVEVFCQQIENILNQRKEGFDDV
ncbi:MAG: hypothetical protein K4571_12110 [Deltaproteobacteria bacterium]